MLKEQYTLDEKIFIAKQIKPATLEDIQQEFSQLKNIGALAEQQSSRCRVGNNIIDYFTFQERLNTRGKYDLSFYDFLCNMETCDKNNPLKHKKFIQNMLTYYNDVKNKNNTKNKYVVYKEVYNICISAINIFRPLVAMEIYNRYKPVTVLDFTCGWGGRLIGACAVGVPQYIGIDSNLNLTEPYQQLINFYKSESESESESKTTIQVFFKDAVTFDYSTLDYDMVFTSPPYYGLEKYSHQPNLNNGFKKSTMDTNFYRPLFKETYKYLKPGGTYILNVNQEIYRNVCVPELGEAAESVPLKKSKRQNNYSEFIYVWTKLG